MKYNLSLFGAAFVLLVTPQLAEAADLPMAVAAPSVIETPSSWTGPYLGADLGYMFGSTSVNDNGVVTETGAATNGFMAGVLAGYNWQLDDLWVAGIEADASFGGVHGNGVAAPITPNSYDLNWAANLRGRIGALITPDTLLYGAGGVALTDLRFTEGDSVEPDRGVTRVGWTVGAGIEHAFTSSLVGRVEYLYSNYGNVTYGTPADNYVVGFSANTVRGALIWKY